MESADWEALTQQLMQVLDRTDDPRYQGAPYDSKQRRRPMSGEVDPDVGWLDPVDLLAGMLAEKGATLARKGAQALRPRTPTPRPVDIPFDRYPLPSSNIPRGPEIDLSPEPLPQVDESERWLGEQLGKLAQRRIKPNPDQLRNLAEDEHTRGFIDYYLGMNRAGGYDAGQPQNLPLPRRFPREPLNIPPADVLLRHEQMDNPLDIIQLAFAQLQKAKGSGSPSDIDYWTKVLLNYLSRRGDTTYNPFEQGL